RASAAERLRRHGFQVSAGEVITASYATACYLREQNPRSCLVLLDGEGRREFDDLPQNHDDPEYVVVGHDSQALNFDGMNRVLALLLKGARLVGMQSELVDHSSGRPQLNVGSWAGMLERAAGVEATYVGKPAAYAFDLALRTLGLGRDEVLMVGDKVSSDIAGANAAGIRSVLLRTGEFDERELAGPVRPDHVLDAFRDLPALLDEIG
ncbi:MAG: HAD hydrolase-like protein, partial [Anaerolineae bacterium]